MAETINTGAAATALPCLDTLATLPQDGDSYDAYIEAMRREQYPMLKDTVFMDHAGSSIPNRRLLDAIHTSLLGNLFGNPHSGSMAGQSSDHMIEKARTALLSFFGARPEDFDLVFTANASAAIKLVGDAMRELSGSFTYAYHLDSHTSLIGIREVASDHVCIETERQLVDWRKNSSSGVKLFAYPAQSNMDGSRLPLIWNKDCNKYGVYTLLDAAAFATTRALKLDDVQPDFTVVSLFKIFGFPDLGALIVKKSSGHLLQHRRYFGGGTVDMVTCGKVSVHAKRSSSLHEQLEDGTLPIHSIAAVEPALQSFQALFGSLEQVSRHTLGLAQQLHDGLSALQHANGIKTCRLYSPRPGRQSSERQGPIVALNLKDPAGNCISTTELEKLATLRNIQLRTGSLCNPGGTAKALQLTADHVLANHAAGHRCGGSNDIVNGQPTGVIRLSLGAFSTHSDVQRLIDFIKEYFVVTRPIETVRAPIGRTQQLVVESLTIYPIKSCAGWSVPYDQRWNVHHEGLEWDREWCIVALGSDKALSQKQYPKMALIRPELDLRHNILAIRFAGLTTKVEVSLAAVQDLKSCSAQVCESAVRLHLHDCAAIVDTFTTFLGIPCTLARFPIARAGAPSQRHSKLHLQMHGRSPPSLSLSNESPILTITRSSLDAVNETLKSRSKRAVHHSSFRANVILAAPPSSRPGAFPPWSEDEWQQLAIRRPDGQSSITLEALGGCRRCQMVCVDQQSGEKRPEVFLSLAKQRRIDGKVLFGIHCALKGREQSTICINDVVDVS